MNLDPVILSRIQFAFVIGFHFLLPAFTIGLSAYIAVLEGLHLVTKKAVYLRLSTFWIKLFAVAFGMGVVSGIVIPFQIGTNWSGYSDVTASVIAPLMTYEAMMAFFLEAGFLGVLLFGRKLVPPWMHFSSAVIVAIGTLFSAFWILAANSWMHTPAGFEIVDGRFVPTDWWAVVFNPSFPYRLLHTVTATYLTTAFAVIGVAAWYLRHGRHVDEAKVMLAMGVILASVLVPAQALIGDAHGLNTLAYEPQKVAAMEGLWETRTAVPAVLFAVPDEANEVNRFEISVPHLASLYLTHSWDGAVRGLKSFAADDRPPVAPVFFAFRIMIGMWAIMFALTVSAWWLAWRGRLFTSRGYLRAATWAIPVGFVAVTAGWTTTEVGRQPYVVHGLFRTSDAVTPMLTGGDVVTSLLAFIAVYIVIYGAGVYYLVRLVRRGFGSDEPLAPLDKRSERVVSGLGQAAALIPAAQPQLVASARVAQSDVHRGAGALLRVQAKGTTES
ncbi:MAG: cytochrome bd ubiquinol oxidase subunit [Betaproteobacteria bacterium]|jgi:cytochrome d ubiquinol oxidase subunit I|nr:cytochrome bd ubiquinol oxidase subunit [Betaproteobacteria bacterium]